MANTWSLSEQDSVKVVKAIDNLIDVIQKEAKKIPNYIEDAKEFKGANKANLISILERIQGEFAKVKVNVESISDKALHVKRMIEAEYGTNVFKNIQETNISNKQDIDRPQPQLLG